MSPSLATPNAGNGGEQTTQASNQIVTNTVAQSENKQTKKNKNRKGKGKKGKKNEKRGKNKKNKENNKTTDDTSGEYSINPNEANNIVNSPIKPSSNDKNNKERNKKNNKKGNKKDDKKGNSNNNGGNKEEYSDKYAIDLGLTKINFGEVIDKALTFTVDMMRKGVKSLIGSFNKYILGLPAPGDPTKPATWVKANGKWPAVYGMYGIMSALAIAMLLPSFMVATDTVDRQKRKAHFVELSKATACILLGIPITALCLHLGNEVVLAMAPKATDFLGSLTKLSNLGVGIIFGAFLIWSKGGIVAIGVLCTILVRLLVFISVAFWPIFWAFRVQPQDTLRSYGNMGISMFPLLILLKFTQAGILRLLLEIPYGKIALVKLVMTAAGLAVALIALPYFTIQKLVPGSAMLMRGMQTQTVVHKHDTRYVHEYHGPTSEDPRNPPGGGGASNNNGGGPPPGGGAVPVIESGPRSNNPDPGDSNEPSTNEQSENITDSGQNNDGSTSGPTSENPNA